MSYQKHRRKSWLVAGATATGVSHIRNNMPNQDAYSYNCVTGIYPTAILAVADGAGSAPRSDEGSRLAVAAAISIINRAVTKRRWQVSATKLRNRRISSKLPRFLKPHFVATPVGTIKLLRRAIDHARTAISSHADAQGLKSDDFATTLLLAVATPRWIVAAQVGDGAMVALNSKTGETHILCQSHSGEYANETVFITSNAFRRGGTAYTGYVPTSQYDAVGITTDGLENLALKMPEREPYDRFWTPMLSWLYDMGPKATADSLNDFVESDRVRARSSDDLTILIAAEPR